MHPAQRACRAAPTVRQCAPRAVNVAQELPKRLRLLFILARNPQCPLLLPLLARPALHPAPAQGWQAEGRGHLKPACNCCCGTVDVMLDATHPVTLT